MIVPADTPMSEMSSIMLQLIIEDAQAELRKRKIEKANREMTKLWKAIENFQKNGFENVVLICGETEIPVAGIGEIYDYVNDCGFSFGPWSDDCEPLTL